MPNPSENEKMCTIHQDKPIVFACFYSGCTQTFLCRSCYRQHPENHDNEIHEFSSVERIENRLKHFKNEKDCILQQQKNVNTQKDQIVSLSKELIETMMDKIANDIQDKKKQLIQQLLEYANTEKDDNTKDLFLKLESDFKAIEDFNPNSEDLFENITQMKILNEEMLPAAKSLIVEVEKVLSTWKLDGSKLDLYEKELGHFTESIQLRDFLLHSPLKSLMHLDISDSLKTVYLNLGLKSRVEILNEEIMNLQQDNSRLTQELEDSIQTNNQIENQMQIRVSNMSEENQNLNNQVNSLNQEKQNLNNQVSSLNQEKQNLNNQVSSLNQEKQNLNNQVHSLNQENQSLKNQAINFTTEINTLKNAKLALENGLSAFKTSICSQLKTQFTSTPCGVKIDLGQNISWYFCKGSQNGCSASGNIWGSNPYTSGGNSCLEARHSGMVGVGGGLVLRTASIETINSFSATTQYGITSCSYGLYGSVVRYSAI